VQGLAIPLVLDGGPCASGLESSIVRVEGEGLTLLRPGALAVDALARAAGLPVAVAGEDAAVAAPGMLLGHYAPRLPLRIDALEALPGEWLIGFGAVGGDCNLSPSADLAEAAANLFAALHAADASGRAAIAVAPVPAEGAGVAINDRLRRAAAKA
jgi:L-threonylcarbamoyladenylate synthase